jgi:hypothetical protein
MTETIIEGIKPKEVTQVGIRLLKFAQLYDLQKISDQASSYADPLNAKYPAVSYTWQVLNKKEVQ